MQIDGPMRLVAVQVEGHGHHRDLHHDERDEDVAPATQTENAVMQQIEKIHVHLWQSVRAMR